MKLFAGMVTLTVLTIATACAPSNAPQSGATNNASPAAASPLQGAWTIAEVTVTGGPDAGKNTTPQPSLYIFAKGHYSIMRIEGTDARPLWRDVATREELTEAEIRSTLIPFIANSGTYSVKGSTLTYRPLVALSPNFMQPTTEIIPFEFRTEADTLWLTSRTTTEPIVETTWRLTRLE